MKLHQLIEQHWQTPNPILRVLLTPLSRLFALIAQHRLQRYQHNPHKIQKLPVPVAIVGNIHAGGMGKTPITAALVRGLQQRGVRVGIISRGYGRQSSEIHVLHAHSQAADAGDEPLMLYRQTAAPMAVGANRYATGQALLAHYPDIQLLVADDGLQHYALHRDMEIGVFPAADLRRLSELDVLPNGSLREPIARLGELDSVVLSQANADDITWAQEQAVFPRDLFASSVVCGAPYRLNQANEKLDASSLRPNQTCVAVAGIARPERFFQSLRDMGIELAQTLALADHAALSLDDLPAADYVFITEKDAVKLPPHAPDCIWVLPIEARIEPDLADWVCAKLGL
ncbi:tetraacyldisaccharide 4'-kinase [Kingella kingae]|uniref:tetraacyldisaccharide 4'-kinase n=1 Tax=Kingella kingae TaxID=504 RepID=UPI0025562CE3|nr:tetraacyldisaccharide 4'-kinase [Kingella kingae]MDK4623915.1 tetraacyldisaccharide 4'-kinase [Kingella kingae]MDK4659541.1 tetraacyldisaccharide 4'-kinase [Kingella kingae]MDK4667448.1 tetraacyldisaccharide 4'-kinase [Kingella kingae]MDK4685854.1 tetraacyldisaccharide 4'-kinase [Kingella kingae]